MVHEYNVVYSQKIILSLVFFDYFYFSLIVFKGVLLECISMCHVTTCAFTDHRGQIRASDSLEPELIVGRQHVSAVTQT